VLTAEATPKLDVGAWTFTIDGDVEQPMTWSWHEIHALPQGAYDGAIHCVTTWSKFDMRWEGVSLDTLFAIARPRPASTHVVAYSHTGYTTNLPRADITDGKPGSPSASTTLRSHVITAAPRGYSCRTSTSGRAPSG
jgi:DMSO/TMAO reductase YedYZ molybdopterin-dependent catalytic subunit